jgi:hypothetical protein
MSKLMNFFKSAFHRFRDHESTVYGLSSVFGTLITLVYTGISFYNSQWKLEYQVVVLALAVIIIFLTILFLSINKSYYAAIKDHNDLTDLVRQKDHCITIINLVIHNILHESRTWIEAFYSTHIRNLGLIIEYHKGTRPLDTPDDPREQEHYKEQFEAFMLYLINNVKHCFDVLTNDTCSVCIKMIDVEAKPPTPQQDPLANLTVRTYLRDSLSYRTRHEIDKRHPQYPCFENTAFKRILDKRTNDTYYLSNGLQNERNYENFRTDWQNSYNATLVVPIRTHCDEHYFVTLGFLCIDNFNGGFDIRGKDLAGSIADHLYNIFRIYNGLSESYSFIESQMQGKPITPNHT